MSKGPSTQFAWSKSQSSKNIYYPTWKFYVQGARLQWTANCRCGNYSTIHPDFVKSLPEGIKPRLPCPITSTKMVSKDISIQIDRSSVGGTSNISQLAQTISQSHTNAFADDSMKYTTHAEYFKQSFAHDQENPFCHLVMRKIQLVMQEKVSTNKHSCPITLKGFTIESSFCLDVWRTLLVPYSKQIMPAFLK